MSSIQIVGHRGAKGEAPENTIAGFLHAKTLGLEAVEFDVHLTRDRKLAVIHDNTVDRTTNATGAVAEFTMAELAALDARDTFPHWPETVGVPTLEQVLEVCAGFPNIQLEIKHDTPERLEEVVTYVLRQLRERNLEDQVIVTSFDAVAIEIVQRQAPAQSRGFIGRPDDLETVNTALRLGYGQVQFHRFREHPADQIQAAHDAGLRVGGGPCDTVEDLEAALALGFAAVTSDFPTLLLGHLAKA